MVWFPWLVVLVDAKYSAVIPERREASSPESIFTNGGYGFRARELRSRPGMTHKWKGLNLGAGESPEWRASAAIAPCGSRPRRALRARPADRAALPVLERSSPRSFRRRAPRW